MATCPICDATIDQERIHDHIFDNHLKGVRPFHLKQCLCGLIIGRVTFAIHINDRGGLEAHILELALGNKDQVLNDSQWWCWLMGFHEGCRGPNR